MIRSHVRSHIRNHVYNVFNPYNGGLGFYAPLLSNLDLINGNGTGTFTRSFIGTVKDYLGNVVTCAANEARFEGARRVSEGVWSDNDGAGSGLTGLNGVLIEEQRTNICLRSEDLGTTWGNSWGGGTTLTLNAAVAPDGNTTADKMASIDSSGDGINQAMTLSANTMYTVSDFYKTIDSTISQIEIYDNNAGASLASLAMDWTGAVPSTNASAGASNIRYEEWVDDWWRISYTFTTAAVVTTHRIIVYPDRVGTAQKSIYAWGAVVEEGAFASSYIATAGATVTRTKDVLWYPAEGNVNESEGSMVCDVNILGQDGVAAFPAILSVSDNSADNAHSLWHYTTASARYSILVGGVATANISANSKIVYGTDQVIGGSYKVNDIEGFIDGASFGTDVVATVPSGLTHIYVGSNAVGAMSINGTVKNLKIYNSKILGLTS